MIEEVLHRGTREERDVNGQITGRHYHPTPSNPPLPFLQLTGYATTPDAIWQFWGQKQSHDKIGATWWFGMWLCCIATVLIWWWLISELIHCIWSSNHLLLLMGSLYYFRHPHVTVGHIHIQLDHLPIAKMHLLTATMTFLQMLSARTFRNLSRTSVNIF